MIKIPVYNFISGEKKGEKKLSAEVFGLAMNESLVHQVYVVLSGNLRKVIAHTKDRSERAGSGKKPWKQKGTGNARVGSVRSPLWRKGGIVFGPTKDRNFGKNINRKMKQKAVLIVLGEKIRTGKFKLVDEIKLAEEKTKNFAATLKKIEIGRSAIVALDSSEKNMKLFARNIKNIKVMRAENLNVYDLLNYEFVLMSEKSAELLEKRIKTVDKDSELKK